MGTTQILIAGFGGQGVLFAGKFLAYMGLMEDKQVSWLPSYGPEMRGGTANCSVIISDESIGSPIVSAPDILIAMNLPSLDKYESSVASGGMIFIDGTLISRGIERNDVKMHNIDATKLASQNGYSGLSNMIIMGKVIKECPALGNAYVEAALSKVVSERHRNLYDSNLAAVTLGYNI